MNKEFETWIKKKLPPMNSPSCHFKITTSDLDLDKPSVRLDLDNDEHMGRITVWSSGESFIEMTGLTGEGVIEEHVYLSNPKEFDSVFLDFFTQMGIHLLEY